MEKEKLEKLKARLEAEGSRTNAHRELYDEHRGARDLLIISLHQEKVSHVEIARLAKCSNSTVSTVLKRNGYLPFVG